MRTSFTFPNLWAYSPLNLAIISRADLASALADRASSTSRISCAFSFPSLLSVSISWTSCFVFGKLCWFWPPGPDPSDGRWPLPAAAGASMLPFPHQLWSSAAAFLAPGAIWILCFC